MRLVVTQNGTVTNPGTIARITWERRSSDALSADKWEEVAVLVSPETQGVADTAVPRGLTAKTVVDTLAGLLGITIGES
jgi:hypothetical protein